MLVQCFWAVQDFLVLSGKRNLQKPDYYTSDPMNAFAMLSRLQLEN